MSSDSYYKGLLMEMRSKFNEPSKKPPQDEGRLLHKGNIFETTQVRTHGNVTPEIAKDHHAKMKAAEKPAAPEAKKTKLWTPWSPYDANTP